MVTKSESKPKRESRSSKAPKKESKPQPDLKAQLLGKRKQKSIFDFDDSEFAELKGPPKKRGRKRRDVARGRGCAFGRNLFVSGFA